MSEQLLPFITELYPKPENSTEWVELYNPSPQSIDLSGWQLWDKLSQPSLLYTFSNYSLPANSFIVIEIGKKLNDTGDGVTLLNNTQNIIDEVSYQNAQIGLGYARDALTIDAEFNWSSPSPNIFPHISVQPTKIPAVTPSLSLFEPSPTPTPTLACTPSPLKSPSPTKNPLPTKTPTLAPTTTPVGTVHIQPVYSSSKTQNDHPTPTIVPPQLPVHSSLISLAVETQPSPTQPHLSQIAHTPIPSRLVYFPSATDPFTTLNVIIGGLCICSHSSLLIWIDWRKNQSDAYLVP